ncbi:MAG: phenylalanine--tRNA ligase subunit alpha [Nanobdellota archaeon]
MDYDKLIASLHPYERQVLQHLKNVHTLSGLSGETGLQQVEVMRGLQWLENKKALTIETITTEFIELDENGARYAVDGLPERVLLEEIKRGAQSLSEITGISQQEAGVAMGVLKSLSAITFKDKRFGLTEIGKKLGETPEELLLKKLSKGPVSPQELTSDEKSALQKLKKRKKIVKVKEIKDKVAHPTEIGKALMDYDLKAEDFVERLTPEMLKDGSWTDKTFRRYDVTINVPQINGGKRHFMNDSIEYAKRIWLDLGFKEITGPYVQTSFWVFDALFTAQDHPVREMQDTFFLEKPAKGKLPEGEVLERVRQAHEKGIAGSTGWQYDWDPEDAKQNVLRTHTTVLSAQTLAALKEVKPGKYFMLGRNFRNETVDWSHLFEFNQTDGIVIDPDANFRNLLGYLKQFFKKMGFPDARFRPAFFSYTEPSVEIDVWHPVHKKWLELGGAGMFRPEVVVPLLGEDIPVLAWGPGFDRVILDYYGITDMRDLYKNDLKQLREMKTWI